MIYNTFISVAFFALATSGVAQGETNLRGGADDQFVNNVNNTGRLLSSDTFTAWTSDGLPPVDCSKFDRLSLAQGVSLRHNRPNELYGWRKDDIQLECSTNWHQGVGSLHDRRTISNLWSPFASEEHGQTVDYELIDPNKPNYADGSNRRPVHGRLCGPDEFMTGIACDGGYCDNVSIRCTRIRGIRQNGNIVGWTDYYTEGHVDLGGPNRAITGFRCRGSHCGQISFHWVRYCQSC